MVERHYRILWLCLVCISIIAIGCSPKEEKKKPVPPLPAASISALGMEIDEADLSDSQQKLLDQIGSDSETNDALIDAFVELHSLAFAASGVATTTEVLGAPIPSTMKAILQNLARESNVNQADQMELKKSLDAAIDNELGEILYNKDHVSFYSYFEKQRMQCFSGTSLYEVIRHMRAGYNLDMAVIIFENGHVLPGYMQRIGRSNRFELVGMETTVIGGKKSYGPADEIQGGVRVIEANFFLATEIFEEKILNMQAVFNKALEITAAKYGLPLVQIEQTIPNPVIEYDPQNELEIDVASLQEGFEERINRSMFAFGSSAGVPSGDQERREVEELAPQASGVNIASGNWDVILPRPEPGESQGDLPVANYFCGTPEGESNLAVDQSGSRVEFGLRIHSSIVQDLMNRDMLGSFEFEVLGDGSAFIFSGFAAPLIVQDGELKEFREEGFLFVEREGSIMCNGTLSVSRDGVVGALRYDKSYTSSSDGRSRRILSFYGMIEDSYVECYKEQPREVELVSFSACEVERALAPLGLMIVPGTTSRDGDRDIFFGVSRVSN